MKKAVAYPSNALQASVIKGTIGLFISPQGEILHVEQSRVNTVIQDTARFSLTVYEIEAADSRYEEPLGVEGAAREEILRELVIRGWIRLRRYVRPQEKWSIIVNERNDRMRALLRDWAGYILSGALGHREDDPFKSVVIKELATESTSCLTILEVSSSKFVAGAVLRHSRTC